MPTVQEWKYMGVNAVFGVIYNATLLPVIAFSGPVVAAVGVMLVIPCVIVSDWLLWNKMPDIGVLFGMVLVMAGFGIVWLEEKKAYLERVEYAAVMEQDDGVEDDESMQDDV